MTHTRMQMFLAEKNAQQEKKIIFLVCNLPTQSFPASFHIY